MYSTVNYPNVKYAGVGSDWFYGVGGDALYSLGINNFIKDPQWRSALNQAPGYLGLGHGLTTKTPTLKEFKDLDEKETRSLIPGVSTSRLIRRRKLLRKLLKKKKQSGDYPLMERYGGALNFPLQLFGGTLLGYGLGKALGKDPYLGGAIGAAAGVGTSLLGALGGSALAGITPRRTLEEQEKYENTPFRALKSLLIPGYAPYNYYKSLGAAKNLTDMSEKEIEEEIKRIRKLKGYDEYEF